MPGPGFAMEGMTAVRVNSLKGGGKCRPADEPLNKTKYEYGLVLLGIPMLLGLWSGWLLMGP